MLAILAAIGYVANQAQSGASQSGIALLQTALPGLFALLAVAILPFYKLTGPQLKTIQDELDQRHAEAVSG
jgi:GPH family glycoside/pentoside/hexuronide:cation symporter